MVDNINTILLTTLFKKADHLKVFKTNYVYPANTRKMCHNNQSINLMLFVIKK